MKPQPKTVRAWAFAWRTAGNWRIVNAPTRERARDAQRQTIEGGWLCGPVVRIEVPAPKERRK